MTPSQDQGADALSPATARPRQPEPVAKLAYTVPQAAEAIGVSAKTLWRRHAEGEIAFVKWHGRTLVRRAELERVLDSLTEAKAA